MNAKKKGVVLIGVLVLMSMFSIMSIPIVNMLVQQSDLNSRHLSRDKAKEIAYAGYKVIESFILNDEEAFQRTLVDGRNDFAVKIPYGDEGVYNNKAEISVKATIENNVITSVSIKSEANYNDVIGVYEDNLYIGSTDEEESVFPTSTYLDTSDSITKLKQRMNVEEIPKLLSEEHKKWLMSNSTFVVCDDVDAGGKVTTDIINNQIEILNDKPNTNSRYVIFFTKDNLQFEKDIVIDLSKLLGANKVTPSLILCFTTNNYLDDNTDNDYDYATYNGIARISGDFTVKNGDLTILSESKIAIENNVNFIQNPIDCQITFGSNTASALADKCFMENIFFYSPHAHSITLATYKNYQEDEYNVPASVSINEVEYNGKEVPCIRSGGFISCTNENCGYAYCSGVNYNNKTGNINIEWTENGKSVSQNFDLSQPQHTRVEWNEVSEILGYING